MTVGTLYFHDLPRAEEGAYLISRPYELADLAAERHSRFQWNEPEPESAIHIYAFVVKGPERVDRYGLMIRADLLDGTPESNADSIRRTMPNGWSVRAHEAMI